MCLYPTLVLNPKYKSNKKNGGNPPLLTDQRIKYVPIGCQDCMECRKQKARNWQVRLMEDLKQHKNGKFITLTFNNEEYTKLNQHERITNLEGYQRDNAIATQAIRYFLERWRKQFGKSLRHWLVTELGHQGTENIHIHGIIWTDQPLSTVEQIWQYGFMWKGKKIWKMKNGKRQEIYLNWVNEQTINYITKYIHKTDLKHKCYKSIVLTSPGIGSQFINSYNAAKNKFQQEKTNTTYHTRTGHKISIPIYWRNKLYSETQREQLWLMTIDEQTRWVCGEKIDISENQDAYYKILKWHQKRNTELGYGNGQKTWEQQQYETQCRNLRNEQRIQNASGRRGQ